MCSRYICDNKIPSLGPGAPASLASLSAVIDLASEVSYQFNPTSHIVLQMHV